MQPTGHVTDVRTAGTLTTPHPPVTRNNSHETLLHKNFSLPIAFESWPGYQQLKVIVILLSPSTRMLEQYTKIGPNVEVKWLTLLLRSREIPISILDQEPAGTRYPGWSVSWFYSVLSYKRLNAALKYTTTAPFNVLINLSLTITFTFDTLHR